MLFQLQLVSLVNVPRRSNHGQRQMAGRGRSKTTLGFHHEPPGGGRDSSLAEKGERSFWKDQVLGAGVRATSTANFGRCSNNQHPHSSL